MSKTHLENKPSRQYSRPLDEFFVPPLAAPGASVLRELGKACIVDRQLRGQVQRDAWRLAAWARDEARDNTPGFSRRQGPWTGDQWNAFVARVFWERAHHAILIPDAFTAPTGHHRKPAFFKRGCGHAGIRESLVDLHHGDDWPRSLPGPLSALLPGYARRVVETVRCLARTLPGDPRDRKSVVTVCAYEGDNHRATLRQIARRPEVAAVVLLHQVYPRVVRVSRPRAGIPGVAPRIPCQIPCHTIARRVGTSATTIKKLGRQVFPALRSTRGETRRPPRVEGKKVPRPPPSPPAASSPASSSPASSSPAPSSPASSQSLPLLTDASRPEVPRPGFQSSPGPTSNRNESRLTYIAVDVPNLLARAVHGRHLSTSKRCLDLFASRIASLYGPRALELEVHYFVQGCQAPLFRGRCGTRKAQLHVEDRRKIGDNGHRGWADVDHLMIQQATRAILERHPARLVLVTGDGDFTTLLDSCIEHGVPVEVVAVDRESLSRYYAGRVARQFVLFPRLEEIARAPPSHRPSKPRRRPR